MTVRRTKNGRWRVSGSNQTYGSRRAAVNADRRRRISPAAAARRRLARARKMRGKRR